MTNRILIVAAHPDDEVLGCGGTIARHVDEGDDVHILIAAEGATSRLKISTFDDINTELQVLTEAAHLAAGILGAKDVHFLKLPDNRLDSLDRLDIIQGLEKTVEMIRPHTVYVHHSGDVNVDHRRLHESVITACRPTPHHYVRRLLSFEVASSTEWQPPNSSFAFQPNWFVDITNQWDRKFQALKAYSSEMRAWPHPRSLKAIEYQANLRGAQVGLNYAEAFFLLRNII